MTPDLFRIASQPFSGRAIVDLIEALRPVEPAGNAIARPLVIGPSNRGAPLLVVVHPGSLCSAYESNVLSNGGTDMRPRIAELAAGWRGDIAVIHGELSHELDATSLAGRQPILDLIDRAWADQTSLVAPAAAEDLEAAACWLITDMQADQRPFVTVTGAWADDGDGCVTIVANFLRRYCLNVIVPDWTPRLSRQAKLRPAARLHPSWMKALAAELEAPYMTELRAFLKAELAQGRAIYPEPRRFFAALDATPLDRVRVVILGQDPYHGPGQAHGLAFSVPRGVRTPPSLVNIFRELHSDLGHPHPGHGCLEDWAHRGVLLLNSVLSVEAGRPGSHAGRGWETFTDAVVEAVNDRCDGVAFVLWGAHAQKKGARIDRHKHLVLEGPHPSPLSAHRGFFGSKPFSRINAWLRDRGQAEIDWRIG